MYFGNLPEEYLLTMIDTERHELAVSDQYLLFGLSGAILLELTVEGRVAFESKNVVVINEEPVDDPIVQEAFELILAEEKVRSALYWVRRLSKDIDNLKRRVISHLVDREIIEVREESRFLIFKTEKFQIKEPEKEKIIKEHIRDIVDQKEESDPRALGFLSLIYATGASSQIFSEEELEEYLQNIRAIVKDEEVGHSISESIQLIIDALMRTQIINYNQFMM